MAAVVREVHGPAAAAERAPAMSGEPGGGAAPGGGGAVDPPEAVTAASLLGTLSRACGHLKDRGDCSEATRLVMWWLTLGPADYGGGGDPPCRRDLCARCCSH